MKLIDKKLLEKYVALNQTELQWNFHWMDSNHRHTAYKASL